MDRSDFERRPTVTTRIRRAAVVLVVCYLAAAALAWLIAPRLMFQPGPASYRAEELDVTLLEEEGQPTLAVHWNPAAEGMPVVLMSHGNAEDLGDVQPSLQSLAGLGVSVCAWDYPGYGASTGEPGVGAVNQGIQRVYDWLLEEQGIPPSRIVLWGRSLGGGPSCWLALRDEVAGLVLESSFTSVYRTVTRVRIFPFDVWDNEAAVRRLRVPVLVIHGSSDRIVPPSHGLELVTAAGDRGESLWLEGVGHNDPDDGTRAQAIRDFAYRCAGP